MLRKTRQFFSAFFSIFSEKSVAVSCLHFGAITALKSPVPQAHSSTISQGSIRFLTIFFSYLCVFLLMTLTKISYTPATLSQNILLPPHESGYHYRRKKQDDRILLVPVFVDKHTSSVSLVKANSVAKRITSAYSHRHYRQKKTSLLSPPE